MYGWPKKGKSAMDYVSVQRSIDNSICANRCGLLAAFQFYFLVEVIMIKQKYLSLMFCYYCYYNSRTKVLDQRFGGVKFNVIFTTVYVTKFK